MELAVISVQTTVGMAPRDSNSQKRDRFSSAVYINRD